jgi:hypothetical protein
MQFSLIKLCLIFLILLKINKIDIMFINYILLKSEYINLTFFYQQFILIEG